MKTLRWVALLPLLALAGPREDYARQWPLLLGRDGGGAYRVVLDREVYRATGSPQLRDVDVINARGETVAADVFAPEAPLAKPARRVPVPWFALPVQSVSGDAPSLDVMAKRDESGKILSLEARSGAQHEEAGARALLIDLSRMRQDIEALEIEWASSAPIHATYRVESSDDLEHWKTVADRVQLLDLAQGDRRLRKNEVPVSMGRGYLRLVPLDDAPALPITGVDARLPVEAGEPGWAWETLPGRRVSDRGRDHVEFRLEGRFPIERVDVQTHGNAVTQWRLESRDSDDAVWQRRAGPWVAYRVADEGVPSESVPQALMGAPVRDRQWRLSSTGAMPADIPALRLGYRPEVVVFLAQGSGPYALVAGSASAQRAEAPMPQLMQALRQARGDEWRPAPAYLQPSSLLAGDAAMQPRDAPRDWKTWTLWALLVGGALLVAGFAFNLLRRPPPA